MFGFFRKSKKTPAPVIDWKELAIQSLENTRYLRSYLNMLNARIESIRSTSARLSKERISQLQKQKEIFAKRLAEEEFNYENYLKKV
jgi:hypothetical protein